MSCIRKIDESTARPVGALSLGQTIGNLIGSQEEQASNPQQSGDWVQQRYGAGAFQLADGGVYDNGMPVGTLDGTSAASPSDYSYTDPGGNTVSGTITGEDPGQQTPIDGPALDPYYIMSGHGDYTIQLQQWANDQVYVVSYADGTTQNISLSQVTSSAAETPDTSATAATSASPADAPDSTAMNLAADYAAIGNPDAAAYWQLSASEGAAVANAAVQSGMGKQLYNDAASLAELGIRGLAGPSAFQFSIPRQTINPGAETLGANTVNATTTAASIVGAVAAPPVILEDAVPTLGLNTARGTISVIGRNPAYVTEAQAIGANYFQVARGTWTWEGNQAFLDEGIASGSSFRLATPLSEAPSTSVTFREIQYLLSNGYRPNFDGTVLLPGGE